MDSQSALNQILARNAAGNPMSVANLRTLATSVDAGQFHIEFSIKNLI